MLEDEPPAAIVPQEEGSVADENDTEDENLSDNVEIFTVADVRGGGSLDWDGFSRENNICQC